MSRLCQSLMPHVQLAGVLLVTTLFLALLAPEDLVISIYDRLEAMPVLIQDPP